MQVFCDFDGTISIKDTTDEILSRFALPEWEVIEASWKKGEIGSAECMRSQISLIRTSKQELDAALDSMPIDMSFIEFVHFCNAQGAPVTVISDGVDYFIHRILKRYHLDHLPVIANHFEITEKGFTLSTPHMNPSCSNASGVCKCAKLGAHNGTCFFVGDGRSDFCAVDEADIVFAKSTLATYCEQKDIPYYSYNTFAEVQCEMKRILPGILGPTPSVLGAPEQYTFA